MNPITIPNISIPTIGIPTIGIPSVGFPSASGGGGLVWPAGMKEHIKAWYDPKKQGMTNFDVIEAYTEDFKKWNNSPEKYTGSLTSNSLAFTNVLQATALIYSSTKPYDFKVLITGLQEGQHIKFGFDYGETILEADKNGVYTIEWKEGLRSYGIYTNFVGDCNITITQLPTSILKDLSGNGNHAYLYGGKGKLNSGMGVYNYVFDNGSNISKIEVSRNKYHVYVNQTAVNGNLKYKVINNPNIEGLVFEIIEKDIEGKVLSYNGAPVTNDIVDFKPRDNAYTIELRVRNDNIDTSVKKYLGVQLLPNAYPDQLCYDGKMYAVCYGFPILTDYTVMAERTWFERQNRACFLSKITTSGTGAFGFEFYNEYNEDTTYSFGRSNNVEQFKDGITYQITNSYNGIVKLDYIVNGKDNAELYIGKLRPSERPAFIGCHGAIIVADRSFTEEEINWLKDNWEKI